MWQALLGFLGGDNGPLSKLLGLIPNVNDRAKAKEEFEKALLSYGAQQDASQNEVNKVEAASASVFVAGWRPFIGWVCGFAMAWQYVLQPFFTWGLAVYAAESGKVFPALPTLDTSQMYTVLMGMLGLGGLRTYERLKGVDRSNLKNDSIDQP